MAKTPEYVKKAVDNYRERFDIIQIRLPKGTKDMLKANGIDNISNYIGELIEKDFEYANKNGKMCQ